MKKLTLLSSFICMVLLSVFFVSVVNADPYTYTGDKPIYPAVYQAVMSGTRSVWSQSKASFSDPNTAVIDHVRTNDGINVADFTLRISLENNVVTYRFSNVMTRLPIAKDSDFVRVDKLQSKTEQSFIDYFDKEIPKIMGNETLYARAKEAADKSLGGPPGGGALAADKSGTPSSGAPAKKIEEKIVWQKGQFTNEWGDKTDQYFLIYSDIVLGTYSNARNKGQVGVRKIIFSESQGLVFDLYNDNGDGRYMMSFDSAEVIIKIGDTEEKFTAKTAGVRTIWIDYSTRLLNLFKREETMTFRVTTNSGIVTYYQFSFSAKQFNEAFNDVKKK